MQKVRGYSPVCLLVHPASSILSRKHSKIPPSPPDSRSAFGFNLDAQIFLYASLWSGTAKNPDVSTGSRARMFARTFAGTTHSLARFVYALRCAHSFACSLNHSRACWKANNQMLGNPAALNQSALTNFKVHSLASS